MWPPPELLALAVALSMDAVAVALARGAAIRPPRPLLPAALLTGLAFGAAQGLMPILGLAAASLVTGMVAGPGAGIGPFLAFLILLVLGIRMIREGLADANGSDTGGSDTGAGGTGAGRGGLIMAALATSIDAAAAGVTLPLFSWPVWASALLIGGVTAALSLCATLAGRVAGVALGRKADILGGALLVAIGARILLDGL
ncbi:manganese efflux pump MntP [Thermaurantiacus sp.]